MQQHEEMTLPKQQAAKQSTLVSVAVNIVLSIAQVMTGILASSQALIADGVHSLSDLIADFVVLFANQHSQKAPDADHQYGHQRYETAASLTLGVLLLMVGAGMLWSSVLKLENPEAIQPVKMAALWIALLALVSKELLFRYMLKIAQQVKSKMLIANAWHARSDAASSLVVALGIVGNLAGFHLFDPIAAMIVGGLVMKMGWEFSWDAMNDLMDRAVDQETLDGIARTLTESPEVRGWHDLRTRKMGDAILVDVHLEIDGQLTVERGHAIAASVQDRLMQKHNVLNVMTHVDPV